ncbi:hypothetical protein DH2020_045592 [Rehmannia glutinosa]|uniref:Polygalacturonase n=1 Tax=Rehmannia glutinosa TaxID=99300 RepID=A0ABR0UFF5_REHGL
MDEKRKFLLQIALESGRLKAHESAIANEASNSKKEIATINEVLKGLVEWLCAQTFNVVKYGAIADGNTDNAQVSARERSDGERRRSFDGQGHAAWPYNDCQTNSQCKPLPAHRGDCISMVFGSQNIDIYDVTCGPGHGISVGSLGRSHEHEYVKGISVRNCSFIGSDNGVRIKTWAPSSYSEASDIIFQDIVMQNPRNPIVIDQQYCPSPHCYQQGESSSAVQIKDVTFKNIWGVSSTKVAVNLQCSGALPCKNVKLINIDLAYNGPGGRATSMCSHVIGSSHGKLVPDGCV